MPKIRSEEIFIIGGGEIFKQMMPYVDKMYITSIEESFEGDVFFQNSTSRNGKSSKKKKAKKTSEILTITTL